MKICRIKIHETCNAISRLGAILTGDVPALCKRECGHESLVTIGQHIACRG